MCLKTREETSRNGRKSSPPPAAEFVAYQPYRLGERWPAPHGASSHFEMAELIALSRRNSSLAPPAKVVASRESSLVHGEFIGKSRVGTLVRLCFFTTLALSTTLIRAQGGPPFITDDPGTPGNKHWEINFGWDADHNPGNAYYQTPDIDMNYGWGDRVQLKYELPMAVYTDPNNTTHAGLGESLLGIKWRYYEHHKAGESKSDANMNFSLGTYPQASINNPTSAVRRGIVENGPNYYLPVEFTAQIGWMALNGEVGRWLGNQLTPSRWGRGLIAGHAFNGRFGLYTELYDLQDANRIGATPKQREMTVDLGGRKTLDRTGHVRLLFMVGRGIQAVTIQNSEPNWIAYLGVQFLLGPKEASE
jgi:hypothetical protein